MRETLFSNCEKEFILQCIANRGRLDGRECYDYRRTQITFGVDRGCCQVEIGKTRVLAQVSCEMTTPKQTRPTEGILFINIELSPMAAPQFEQGRQSELGTELTRILERCIKESRCVDTESLCVMAGVKVWTIRLDLHVLNHEGNLIDCASIAALAALAHFRRPDVTVSGEEVTVHALEDRDPVPLSVHHMPLCVTIAFFDQGKFLLVDPTEKEEKVMDGKMVIGMNKHREICTFQLTGSMLLTREQVLRCSNISVVKVTEMTELIQQALENDTRARAKGEKFGFAVSVETKKVTASEKTATPVDMAEIEEQAVAMDSSHEEEEEEEDIKEVTEKVQVLGNGAAAIGLGGTSTWEDEDADEEMAEEMLQDAVAKLQKEKPVKQPAKQTEVYEVDSSSEEESVVMLEAGDMDEPKAEKEGIPAAEIDLTKAVKKSTLSKSKKGSTQKKKQAKK